MPLRERGQGEEGSFSASRGRAEAKSEVGEGIERKKLTVVGWMSE